MAHDAHAPTLERKAPHLNTSEHKKVGWLELFYDLVYVATIVQLGNKLSEDVSVEGFITFALLFIPMWWVWMGTTFYYTRFNADDLVHRALVFLQIVTISALAISVYDGLGETSVGFAVSYAVARLLLVAMYLRASHFVPEARALANRYAAGFTIAAALWLISAFVPPPLRFVLWIVGLLVDFGTPLSPGSVRLQKQLPPSAHHLPERMGLFTIIVFGESFIKVIGGFAGHELETNTVLIGFLGLTVVGGLWWIYNETVAERGVMWRRPGVQAYIYGHLPLQLALISLAVGIYKLVTQHSEVLADKYRLLVAGSVALFLVAQGVIEFWTDRGNRQLDLLLRIIAGAIAMALGLFATGMPELLVIGALSVIILALTLVDLTRQNRPIDNPGETQEIELGTE